MLLLLLVLYVNLSAATAACGSCPLNVTSCSVGGITYSNCYYGTSGVYFMTAAVNTACLPSNRADPATYYGYTINSISSSACYNTTATTCPSNCLSCQQGATNCRGGMYGVSLYNSAAVLVRFLQCSLVTAVGTSRGDLFRMASSSSSSSSLRSASSCIYLLDSHFF